MIWYAFTFILKVLVALLAILAVKLAYKAIWEYLFMPKGPWGLPLMGYLPFFPTPYETGRHFMELGKKYKTDVMMVNVGEHTSVIVNGWDAIEEAFRHPDMQGRPNGRMERVLKEAGQDGVFTNQGPSWVFTRRIAMKAVSMFTSSKSSRMADAVDSVSRWLVNEWRSADGQPVETASTLYKVCGAMTGSMIFGFDPDPNNEVLAKITELEEWMEGVMGEGSMLVMFFPSLEFLDRKQERREVAAMTKVMDYIRSWTRDYKPSPGGEIRNILDSLDKVVREVPEEEKRRRNTTDERIKAIVFDLFQAGTGSIQEALVWTMLTISRFPEVQQKAYEEIQHFCGDEFPQLDKHQGDLSYTKAILYETWRWITNYIFDGNQKATMADVNFRGTYIPKGTAVWANITSVHHDPDTFKNPELFNPGRFIAEDGTFDTSSAARILVFGYGARRCIGEFFTLQFAVVFLASVIQAFHIRPDPYQKGDPLREVDQMGFGYMPATHKLEFIPRKKENMMGHRSL